MFDCSLWSMVNVRAGRYLDVVGVVCVVPDVNLFGWCSVEECSAS